MQCELKFASCVEIENHHIIVLRDALRSTNFFLFLFKVVIHRRMTSCDTVRSVSVRHWIKEKIDETALGATTQRKPIWGAIFYFHSCSFEWRHRTWYHFSKHFVHGTASIQSVWSKHVYKTIGDVVCETEYSSHQYCWIIII